MSKSQKFNVGTESHRNQIKKVGEPIVRHLHLIFLLGSFKTSQWHFSSLTLGDKFLVQNSANLTKVCSNHIHITVQSMHNRNVLESFSLHLIMFFLLSCSCSLRVRGCCLIIRGSGIQSPISVSNPHSVLEQEGPSLPTGIISAIVTAKKQRAAKVSLQKRLEFYVSALQGYVNFVNFTRNK